MKPWQLRSFNRYLAIFSSVLLLGLIFAYAFAEASQSNIEEFLPKKKIPIPYSFQQSEKSYEQIGPPFLSVTEPSLNKRLPDVRTILVSYGVNKRPDAEKEKSSAFLGIRGQQGLTNVKLNENIYLKYESKQPPFRWKFSENNHPTNIWIVPRCETNQVLVRLYMQDPDGTIIQDPIEFANFQLAELALPANSHANSGFEIGGQKADANILTNHKARWYGQDLFLDRYGGEEFQSAKGKERIEFESDGLLYSCHVGENDCLVFSDGMWRNIEPSEESRGKPLLEVRKVDDQMIGFNLWDHDGKYRIMLDLRRTPTSKEAAKVNIKLVGARSKKEWIAEVSGKRKILRPDDWLISLGSGDYERFTDPDQIDSYIAGELKGELIVLDGIQKIENEQSLVGTHYDITRTVETPIKISVYKSWVKEGAGEKFSKHKNMQGRVDYDDDFDDDYDEDEDDYFYDDDDFDVDDDEKYE